MSAIANILVVDDKPENLLAVEATLERLGQRVVRARSGQEALRAVLHDDFAVILLDVQMPTLNGLETASLIKQRERSRYTPIIFLTANDHEMNGVMRAYEQGAVDILFKPFHPDILCSKVAVFVELFNQRERLREQEEQLRRQAREQAAREEAETQQRRLDALFEEMPAVIGVLRAPDQVYVLANAQLHALHHGRPLVGRTARAAHPELASTGLLARLDEVFATGRPFAVSDQPVPDASTAGGTRYFNFAFKPMMSEGQVDSVILFATEVTEQVLARLENARLFEAERRGREQLALLAEAGATLASSLDHETTLPVVARLAVPALGDYGFFEVLDEDGLLHRAGFAHRNPDRASLLERAPRPALSYPDEHPVARAIARGEAQLIPDVTDEFLRRITTDAEQLARIRRLAPRSIVCVPLVSRRTSVGALMLVFAESKRTHTKDDLHLAEEIARRAAMAVDNARLFKESQDSIRLRDDFLSIASHELNTPLTPLKMQIAMLRRGIGGTDTAAKLAMADRQVDRMAKLISRLLDVSRIVGGRLTLDAEPVNLLGVLREVVAQFQDEASKAGSALRLHAESDAVGTFDRMRVEQVLVNLVTNAIKYGSGKPIDLDLEVTNGRARIQVRDRGIGIEPRMQARIFDRFERAVSSRHYGGFGLGLWIARQIVEASGGKIAVESKPGEGSVFSIELPLSASDDQARRGELGASAPAA